LAAQLDDGQVEMVRRDFGTICLHCSPCCPLSHQRLKHCLYASGYTCFRRISER
jgi:hypothetical protein